MIFMKKLAKTVNKPIVLIATLITAFCVIIAKFFMTKDDGDEE